MDLYETGIGFWYIDFNCSGIWEKRTFTWFPSNNQSAESLWITIKLHKVPYHKKKVCMDLRYYTPILKGEKRGLSLSDHFGSGQMSNHYQNLKL